MTDNLTVLIQHERAIDGIRHLCPSLRRPFRIAMSETGAALSNLCTRRANKEEALHRG